MAILDRKSTGEPDFFSTQVMSARRFFRPEAAGGAGTAGDALRIISGGLERCIPGYSVRRSSFPYWALEFVVSGKGSLTLNNRRFELAPGTLYAYSPGVSHRIEAGDSFVLEKYFVDIIPPAALSPQDKGRYDLFAGKVILSSSPETLRKTFEEIIEYGRIPTEGAAAICSRLADLLLLKTAETGAARGIPASANPASSAAFAAYTRSRELIERRFLEFASAGAAAREANMDVSYLCRLFKRFDDFTPYGYLTHLRMHHAAGRLVRDGISVKAAAAELNCTDEFTFSRRFKAVMGISPGKFAETYRRE